MPCELFSLPASTEFYVNNLKSFLKYIVVTERVIKDQDKVSLVLNWPMDTTVKVQYLFIYFCS